MSPRVKRTYRKLSLDLEQAILGGMLSGVVPKDAIEPEETSKAGRFVLDSIRALDKPSLSTVLLHGVEVLGAPKGPLQDYLNELSRLNNTADTADVLRKVRDKQVLLDLINEAGAQIQKGSLDLTMINGLLVTETRATHNLESVSDQIKDGLPPPPTGIHLRSLPYLSQQTGGFIGMWAIGGEPAVGKSALAWQVTLDVALQNVPVLYYDFENGFQVLMDRTRSIFKGNLDRIREATNKVYIRESIRSLDSDLARLAPPALVVIDSIQKLPGSVEYRRSSLDRWIHRLEALKKRGYYVLLVSEISRGNYGSEAYIGAYKESGEIEYSADMGVHLLDGGGLGVNAVIVKNRHRPFRGPVALLQRKNDWYLKEVPVSGADAMEPQEID